MGEATIVLYPVPAIGHLVSMVELAKLILASQPSFSVHILVTTAPYNASDTATYIASVTAAIPALAFHQLPPITPLPDLQSSTNPLDLLFGLIRLNTPFVADALAAFSNANPVAAFIVDFFCGPTLSVSTELDIPSFFFFPTAASSLAPFLFFPTIHRATSESFRDLGATPIRIPGLLPVKAIDMPAGVLERGNNSYEWFLDSASVYLPRSTGIIVNTFEALEPRAVKAISDGQCIPDGETPRVHCIGPLISGSKERRDPNSERCLSWLDSQPSRSVVFLCFGSLGLFSMEQLQEIGIGLERSGQRFLWVVRHPLQHGRNQKVTVSDSKKSDDADIEELLPKGFLERTRERGLVVKNWAPQVAVLAHGSVGGFVTHCGWNSVLESVVAGVPMVAWPLYAEQRLNRVVLVEEIGIAIPMNESDSTRFVGANEVKRRVSELMEGSHSVCQVAMRMKSKAEAALSNGGSSRLALTELTESWKQRG